MTGGTGRKVLIGVGVVLALAFVGSIGRQQATDAPEASRVPESTATPEPGYVSRAMLGDAWPLTVEEGTLACSGLGAVTFNAGGMTYAVNGLAQGSTDLPEIDVIWADDPTGAAPKKDIGPLIERGLALCG